ncbi:MAG: phage portal protein, partial [Clostridiales bacterium]|nr:phage portal protein [Clostridiales bacterium]
LTLQANIDQTGRAFILDLVLSMFDEGVVAVVPIDTDISPDVTDGYKIYTMRTARILQWFPSYVKVRAYDDRIGQYKEIDCPKDSIAIIENPFYTVMNEPNSTAKRLMRKLNLIDMLDERNSGKKLDLIIQLPYIVKSEARRQQAEHRRLEIEKQLTSSEYGIAYTDGTENIIQLNRPVENQLATQVQDLRTDLYAQLGITQAILDGSASEQQMLNYYSRTVEPILSAIADEFKRKFLTKNARTRGQSIWFFRDPFKLVPVEKIADIADKFTRNEILSSNEIRAIVGYKPVDDPAANELRNKNLNQPVDENGEPKTKAPVVNDTAGEDTST